MGETRVGEAFTTHDVAKAAGDGPSDPDDGDTSDVVEGPVGSASLKDPREAEASAADLDALPDYRDRANEQPPVGHTR